MQNQTKRSLELSQSFETLSLELTCNSNDVTTSCTKEDEGVEPCRKKPKLDHFTDHFTDRVSASVSSSSSSSNMDVSIETNVYDGDDENDDDGDDDDDDDDQLCELEVDMATRCARLDQAALLDQVEALYDQEDTLVECFYLQAVEELRFSQAFF